MEQEHNNGCCFWCDDTRPLRSAGDIEGLLDVPVTTDGIAVDGPEDVAEAVYWLTFGTDKYDRTLTA